MATREARRQARLSRELHRLGYELMQGGLQDADVDPSRCGFRIMKRGVLIFGPGLTLAQVERKLVELRRQHW